MRNIAVQPAPEVRSKQASTPDRARKKSRAALILLFVTGVAGHVLNLAGVADAIVSWRAFFEMGILDAYTMAKREIFALFGLHLHPIVQDLLVSAACTLFIFSYAFSGSWSVLYRLALERRSRFHLISMVAFAFMFFLGLCAWTFVLGGMPVMEAFGDNPVERTFVLFYTYIFSLATPIIGLLITAQVVRAESGLSMHAIPKRFALAMAGIIAGFIALLFVAADLSGAI